MTRVDSLVPLMHHDPSDLGSLIRIQITPKERTVSFGHREKGDQCGEWEEIAILAFTKRLAGSGVKSIGHLFKNLHHILED